MKRLIVRRFILLVVAVLAVLLASCSLFGVKFINNSSYTVEVTPLDQEWEFFILDPGETHSVSPKEGYVSFLYWPASTVACDDSLEGKVVFTNR